jgi:hypothetical protein
MWQAIPGVSGMLQPTGQDSPSQHSAFEHAGNGRPPSLAVEFWLFIRDNKKWWMIPIMVVLGLVGMLGVLAATGAAPFIYTFF